MIRTLIALSLVAALGVAHGLWIGRWATAQELEDAIKRLDAIPDHFGDWQSQPMELDPRVLEIAEVEGYLARSYTNQQTGTQLTVLIVCGRPGPISVHTPDVCYAGSGYATKAAPANDQITLGTDRTAQFKQARFEKDDAVAPDALDIFWSWTPGDTWQAPDRPRMRFAPYRALYKLYVVRRAGADSEADGAEACRQFLQEFLPIVEAGLSATAEATPRDDSPNLSAARSQPTADRSEAALIVEGIRQ